jgi:hypothetical protein
MKTMNHFLTIPITQGDRLVAQKFANQYGDFPTKETKVLENILAVCAVKNYLQVLGIATDISKNYSFNLAYQLTENVADLYLTGIGRLECRPVKSNQNICHIPAETWSNRIGYVAVELAPNYSEAKLLGFIEQVTTENLPIEQLNSLDNLLETITEIELVKIEESVWQKIKNWVDKSLELGWQTFDEIFSNSSLEYAYETIKTKNINGVLQLIETIENPPNEKKRQEAISLLGEWGKNSEEAIAILSEVIKTTKIDNTRWQAASSLAKIDPNHRFVTRRTAKLLNLGLDLEGQEIALCINLLPTEDENNRIRAWLQLCSQSSSVKLPPNLKLSIISESNEVIKEINSRSDITGSGIDDSIEMRFLFVPGQNFQITVTLNDKIVAQEYIDI